MKTLVLVEHENGALKDATLAAVAAASKLGEVHLLVAGRDVGAVAEAASKIAGVGKVHVADDAAYANQLAENVAPLAAELMGHHDAFVAPATTTGKNVAPRVAALLDVMQISDVIGIEGEDTFVRPIYAGNAVATVRTSDAKKVLTVRGTAFEKAAAEGGSGTIEAVAWRQRMAGAFQDFVRFELPAQSSVGLGDLARVDDPAAVTGAVVRAGAVDVIERLPEGLSTQLGPSWPGGVDLSGGQWQKLALARGLVREDPLLVVLDEPTSALDAETEHALFERFAEQARVASEAGRVTVLVSHRFSTVRMADLIVVMSGSRVVEVGTHDELVAIGGTYAELYAIQAAAYR